MRARFLIRRAASFATFSWGLLRCPSTTGPTPRSRKTTAFCAAEGRGKMEGRRVKEAGRHARVITLIINF